MKTSRIIVVGASVLLATLLGQAQTSSTAQPDQNRRQSQPTNPPSGASQGSPASIQPNPVPHQDSTGRDREKWQSHATSSQSTGVQASVTTTTEIEPQVRTIVQEIDAEGPVVVE